MYIYNTIYIDNYNKYNKKINDMDGDMTNDYIRELCN